MPEPNLERNLAVSLDGRQPGPVLSLVQLPSSDEEPAEARVPLSHYLWILKRQRWKICGFVLAAVVATVLISLRLTPVYEATATVDVDRQTPLGIIGQEATRSLFNDSDQFLSTQVKLIQSDSVLRPVVRRFRLREVEQQTPFVSGKLPTTSQEDAPVLLKKLRVVRPPNTYLLLISYRATDPRLAAAVSNAIAQSYIEHTYNLRFRASTSLSVFMEKQMEELKAKMERSTSALAQFERELNVINPEEKTSILSARLLQLNTEFTTAQADRLRKEAAFLSARSGTLEAAQVSAQGEALRRIGERLNEAQEKFVDVKAHYGLNHPEYRKAAATVAELQRQLETARQNAARRVETEYHEALERETMLGRTVAETKAEFDRLNARSFEYQQLKREAEADKKFYEELLRRIKEAGINASFQNSSVRLADAARPPVKPVLPDVKLNVLLAFLFATLLAVGTAVVGDVLDNTVRDPDEISRSLNTAVVGTLPSVKDWRRRLMPVTIDRPTQAVATADNTVAGFSESIRTLRNSILLADFDRRVKSILVTSASPAEGKSTTAAFLAMAHAEQAKRTLLIDGDLRRPSVHRRFSLTVHSGLSDVLTGDKNWREVLVRPRGIDNLDILPAGPASRRASALVGASLGALLDEAGAEYDLVILDAPPLLGFAEPLEMATTVDGVLVVARAGETNRKAVASVILTLQRLRVNVMGVVLNEVHKDVSDGYYYYGHYYHYYHRESGVSS
jgi:capsular exopolysaccharide synthesis family protein